DKVGNTIPSNVRKQNLRRSQEDQAYIKLYFDACRYLLISCSRSGSLPANLQGVWCDTNFPAWNSDYHTNINVQMNYWAASPCGMGECLESLFGYIEGLVAPGSVTAKAVYGARGWVVNTASNPWGYTTPDNLKYGWAPYGSSWLMQRMWEHYAFTADKEFLRERCYPILKDIALFWEDYLTEDTDGTLVSAPSFSPEHGPVTVACAFDQVMAWNHLTNCIDASRDLGVDKALREKWTAMRDRLSPLRIGKWGQLQEWKEDIDDPKDRHRHINHLFSVFPGRQISPVTTPKLADAARVLIKGRGESGPGWSTAWKTGILARLGDAAGAHRKVRQIATGTYDNMFGAHRLGGPFQFDSNGGGSSAIPEMILQSHMGFLHLLPALPEQWPEGSFEGLRARGGYVCDIFWKEGRLDKAVIRSTVGSEVVGRCRIRYKDIEKQFAIGRGEEIIVRAADF
ncbi:MAG: glycosyl hydrolase family 95 catalytic domain-containing protein, partial [Planctomycetota bacterium]